MAALLLWVAVKGRRHRQLRPCTAGEAWRVLPHAHAACTHSSTESLPPHHLLLFVGRSSASTSLASLALSASAPRLPAALSAALAHRTSCLVLISTLGMTCSSGKRL